MNLRIVMKYENAPLSVCESKYEKVINEDEFMLLCKLVFR